MGRPGEGELKTTAYRLPLYGRVEEAASNLPAGSALIHVIIYDDSSSRLFGSVSVDISNSQQLQGKYQQQTPASAT
jgi:hypothetical protein